MVSFFRKALQDIRFLPRNPFTEWLEIDQQKTDFRITVLNVTIDDVDLIYDPFLPHFESMIERFDFSCTQTLLLISSFGNLLEFRICKLGYENGDWFQDFIILWYTENAEFTQM